MDLKPFMALALEEARTSLREGNCGFGAAIVRDGQVLGLAHDTEKTAGDPTAHAEMTAIRQASARLGRDLSGCVAVSTHEPCPMCATALYWSGIDTIAYGYSIAESLQQERRRIDLTCAEIYRRGGKAPRLIPGVMREECAVLYNRRVRESIKILRGPEGGGLDREGLTALAGRLAARRLAWFRENRGGLALSGRDILQAAYGLFLRKLSIDESQAPVVRREPGRLVIHSVNFCPTLEACNILGLDTREVCAAWTEGPMDALLKALDPRLRFTRNYDALRPAAPYCEEMIILD